jgi:outer membrane scaffolding protein for murein synthesis (MipA/OmpV family)
MQGVPLAHRAFTVRRRSRVGFVIAVVVGIGVGVAQAEDKPLWEAGVGLGVLSLPDYRGSDESRIYALPFPYVVYRGDFFKADREGTRVQFLDTDRIRFEVGVSASQPVRSSNNQARQGMPDLKGSFEAGPALDVILARSDDRKVRLDFRLPVSTGVTLGGGFKGIGWQASPRVNLDIGDVAGVAGLNLGLATGPLFASRKRDAYFYDVDSQYVRAGRPAYRSDGGYAGAQVLAALSKRIDRYWIGGFVRADTLQGASFADSPLVRRKSYVAYGIGVSYVFGQSSQMVDVPEDR